MTAYNSLNYSVRKVMFKGMKWLDNNGQFAFMKLLINIQCILIHRFCFGGVKSIN